MYKLFFLSILLISSISFGQSKRKPLFGTVYTTEMLSINVAYFGKDSFDISPSNKKIEVFLKNLTLTKIGRSQLIFLLKTHSKIAIDISSIVCISSKDSKYHITAGMTGPLKSQNDSLVTEFYQPKDKEDTNYVFIENTITLYEGCLTFIKNPKMHLDSSNVVLFDLDKNKEIKHFSMDSILVEPFLYPELLYKNETEFLLFTGIHEIEHLKPENIFLQLNKGDVEYEPMLLEEKAFKRRKRINRKSLIK